MNIIRQLWFLWTVIEPIQRRTRQGRYEEALSKAELALARAVRSLCENSLGTSSALVELSKLQALMGDYPAAESTMQRQNATSRAWLGSDGRSGAPPSGGSRWARNLRTFLLSNTAMRTMRPGLRLQRNV